MGQMLGRSFAARKSGKGKVVKITEEYDINTAIRLLKAYSYRAFDESVDVCIKLGINPKRSDLSVRGSCSLPNGIGKKVNVCFLPANEEEAERARKVGVTMIADSKVLEDISKEVINFDNLYATQGAISKLKPFARILGPKGLFPNTKVNTLITADDIGEINREIIDGGHQG